MKTNSFAARFVEYIPKRLDDGVLYISLEYTTATHRCACGCGMEVVTPLSPTDWQLIFDGSVSLNPSIGNWSFKCRSHYWIRHNKVQWARQWSEREIAAGRALDAYAKAEYYGKKELAGVAQRPEPPKSPSFWERIKRFFGG